MTGLPFAVECCPEGRWDWLYMAVVLDTAVDWEGQVVLELIAGVVHVILQLVLKQEEQHWPVQGTAVIQAYFVLEVD